ncbi:hypothetical protein DQ04_01961040 [Trypanosoma grayi]|uniref:hypothetical protein n=1 Tax=Trypanosoma grayi TaxID=71804 RepID=UPI0004F49A66|nr:hypothetical protein DQ04_01961040 [Trypanosoma grayi]KEG12143.1 hypothetical protein DQ04_01961040 [Trypanosoma grayi]
MLCPCRRLCHGPAARSQSVLAALLRIRQQYQRPPHALNRRDTTSPRDFNTVTVAEERQRLMGEAMKILRKEVRGADALSDVDATSATFCVEVGKLLSVAAAFGAATTTPRVVETLQWVRVNKSHLAFGAATTTPRVVETLQWVRVNKSHLTSPRQVMSICMPLLNLRDGRSAGRNFVVTELCTPLLTALEAPMTGAEALTELELKQHRSAITSVFNLVGKMLDCGGSSSSTDVDEMRKDESDHDGDQLGGSTEMESLLPKQAALLFTHGVDALLLLKERSLPPLEVVDCLHILQACQRLEAACTHEDVERVHAALTRVLPMIDAALGPSAGGTTKRPSDVCHLLSVASRLQQRESMAQVSRTALALLPPALASSTVKDICVALQVLARLRNSAPEVADAPVLQRIVDAARPRLFLLNETLPGTLRHIECSVLMTNFTRLDVDVSEDLINLLCNCFLTHMELAQPAQLIPFLQGLSRYSEAAMRSSSKTNSVPLWESSRLSALLPCLEQTADRVVVCDSACRLTSHEAAQLLLALSQLRCPRVVTVYVALEPTLEEAIERLSTGVVDSGSDNGNSGETQKSEQDAAVIAGLTALIMQALHAFRSEAVTFLREEEMCVRRAGELYEKLRNGAIDGIAQIQQPKGLVMLLHLLTPEGRGAGYTRLEDGGSSGNFAVDNETAATKNVSSPHPLDAAAQQVCCLAPVSNAYEVGALAKAMGELCSKGLVRESEAQEAIATLLQRSEVVELTLYDTQSLLDGMRRAHVLSMPSAFLRRIAALLQTAPKKTTSMIRRLLPLLKAGAVKPNEMDALVNLVVVAMGNARTLMAESTSPPPLRETALLAYTLAQLYGVVSTDALADNDVEVEVVPEEAGVEESAESIDDTMDEVKMITHEAFKALGDAACSCLQQHVNSNSKNTNNSGTISSGNSHQISPQEVVMLVQSFENVGVRHYALLYEVLPLVRDMSEGMEPLELSLLLNAFARLGVWNGRVLDALARNVAEKVQTCSLKQCQSILKALQSSGFLRPSAFVSTPEHQSSVSRDWHSAGTQDTHAAVDPLVALATSVVGRMNTLIERPESVAAVLQSHSLEDVVSVVRVLGFFDQPPQPAFDMYLGIGIKRLVSVAKEASDDILPHEQRKRLMAIVSLSEYVCRLRQYDRQCVSTRAIVHALPPHALPASLLTAGLQVMPEEKVAELYYWRCVFAMLYSVPFPSEEALPVLQVVSEKLWTGDVVRNPRRVGTALRYLTKINCDHIGDPNLVCDIVFSLVRRQAAGMDGGAADAERNEKQNDLQSLYSVKAATALIEALCSCCLITACSTRHHDESQRLIYFVEHLLMNTGQLRPVTIESAALLAVAAIDVTGRQGAEKAWLDEVQQNILVKESQLSVHDAVNILLAGALTHEVGLVKAKTVECAARVLTGQLGKTDQTGLWLLPELHRLLTTGNACFATWCEQSASVADSGTLLQVHERVVPALLRSLRSANKNTSPTLSVRCRTDVADVYRYCAAARVGSEELGELVLDARVAREPAHTQPRNTTA